MRFPTLPMMPVFPSSHGSLSRHSRRVKEMKYRYRSSYHKRSQYRSGDLHLPDRTINFSGHFPVEIVHSNYFAVVETEDCTGCETCLERCQMGAIHIAADGVAHINRDRCIGCGLCVTTCPTEALKLVPKPEEELRVPPATMMEQMIGMARKRGLI